MLQSPQSDRKHGDSLLYHLFVTMDPCTILSAFLYGRLEPRPPAAQTHLATLKPPNDGLLRSFRLKVYRAFFDTLEKSGGFGVGKEIGERKR